MPSLLDMYDPQVIEMARSFGPSDEDKQVARNMALMQAGFGMMANNSGRNGRNALFNAIGQGGMQGMGAYQQSLEQAKQNQIRQLQVAEAMDKQLQASRQREAINKLPEDQRRAVMSGVPMAEIWKRNNPALPDGMRFNANGEPEFIPGYIESMRQLGQAKNPVQPYYTPIPTANGVVSFDNRSGTAKTISLDGTPIVKSADDPRLQGKIVSAKTAAKEVAETDSAAISNYPKVEASANEVIGLVDEVLKHPGKKAAVGLSSTLDPRNYIRGTDATDFKLRLQQLEGKQFLQAFESLKGGGQITEVEGKKATAALSRMNVASSEEEFDKAAKEFKGIVQSGLDRARTAAGPVTYPSDAGKPGVRVPSGESGRNDILSKELAIEQQKLNDAKTSGDLKGISEANRNIQLLQKELGAKSQTQSVRKYNPSTGRIE